MYTQQLFGVITNTLHILMLIRPEEQKQNPNAVINALKTYENSLRHMGERKYIGADSVEDVCESSGESDKSRESSMVENASSSEADKSTPEEEPSAKEKEASDNDKVSPLCAMWLLTFNTLLLICSSHILLCKRLPGQYLLLYDSTSIVPVSSS